MPVSAIYFIPLSAFPPQAMHEPLRRFAPPPLKGEACREFGGSWLPQSKKTMKHLLTCHQYTFGAVRELMPPLDWHVEPGEYWTIVGPNGCGKTTLLRSLLGLMPCLDGTTSLVLSTRYFPQTDTEGTDIPARVWDIVAGGLESNLSFLNPLHLFKSRHTVAQILARLDLTHLRYRQYATLSPGERQRVRLARTMVSRPRLIFLDEATSAMDSHHAIVCFEILNDYRKSHDASIVSISHHLRAQSDVTTHILAFVPNGYLMGLKDTVLRDPAYVLSFEKLSHETNKSLSCNAGHAVINEALCTSHTSDTRTPPSASPPPPLPGEAGRGCGGASSPT